MPLSISSASARTLSGTLTPFLYPCLDSTWLASRSQTGRRAARGFVSPQTKCSARRWQTTVQAPGKRSLEDDRVIDARSSVDVHQYDHLTPAPREYSDTPFTDSCTLAIHAGGGGHGCISFLREKYIANGPANGGDGGTGGSIYIQAVRGETSLHKIARRGMMKAGRGKNGQGTLKGGKRGEDVVLTVPVGTVVREIRRYDPIEEETKAQRQSKAYGRDAREAESETAEEREEGDQSGKWRRDKWLLYPGILPKSFTSADFPVLPRPRRSNLAFTQPPAPLRLDLDKPMTAPMLLAAGAMGGLGNPHFVTKSVTRPKFATKGEDGVRIQLQLELKLLGDVGLVGLPNAGKSTLLRALTSSRARIGSWAFTTLSPNIGTVILDSHSGRLSSSSSRPPTYPNGEPRTSFTIADIPGLVEDAHLDRGLGLGFLRHIERAGVLAFVVDLSAGDAVKAVQGLWKEVAAFEDLRHRELNEDTETASVAGEGGLMGYTPFNSFPVGPDSDGDDALLSSSPASVLPELSLPPISSKPWLVVATKADLPDTQERFAELQAWLKRVESGEEAHPSGKANAWRKRLSAVPVCAMKKEGVDGVRAGMLSLLGESSP